MLGNSVSVSVTSRQLGTVFVCNGSRKMCVDVDVIINAYVLLLLSLSLLLSLYYIILYYIFIVC